MTTNTAITTAARRIARTLNAGTTGIDYFFNDEGEQVDTMQHGCEFPAGQVPEHTVRLASGKWSQRDAQDQLDAAAAHPRDRFAQEDYLHALYTDREAANH